MLSLKPFAWQHPKAFVECFLSSRSRGSTPRLLNAFSQAVRVAAPFLLSPPRPKTHMEKLHGKRLSLSTLLFSSWLACLCFRRRPGTSRAGPLPASKPKGCSPGLRVSCGPLRILRLLLRRPLLASGLRPRAVPGSLSFPFSAFPSLLSLLFPSPGPSPVPGLTGEDLGVGVCKGSPASISEPVSPKPFSPGASPLKSP